MFKNLRRNKTFRRGTGALIGQRGESGLQIIKDAAGYHVIENASEKVVSKSFATYAGACKELVFLLRQRDRREE